VQTLKLGNLLARRLEAWQQVWGEFASS
jgi:hypothetical protein